MNIAAAATLRVNAAAATMANALTGTGTLEIAAGNGADRMVISGYNGLFTGTTHVTTGTVAAGSHYSLGTGKLIIDAGATADFRTESLYTNHGVSDVENAGTFIANSNTNAENFTNTATGVLNIESDSMLRVTGTTVINGTVTGTGLIFNQGDFTATGDLSGTFHNYADNSKIVRLKNVVGNVDNTYGAIQELGNVGGNITNSGTIAKIGTVTGKFSNLDGSVATLGDVLGQGVLAGEYAVKNTYWATMTLNGIVTGDVGNSKGNLTVGNTGKVQGTLLNTGDGVLQLLSGAEIATLTSENNSQIKLDGTAHVTGNAALNGTTITAQNGTGKLAVTGNVTAGSEQNNVTLDSWRVGTFDIISAGSAIDPAGFAVGQSFNATRQTATLQLANAGKTLQLVTTADNSARLEWTGGNDGKTWSLQNANWNSLTPETSADTFAHGDIVVFNGKYGTNGNGAIEVTDAPVVSGMEITNGTYVFTGDTITGTTTAASGNLITPHGQLRITGDDTKARFDNAVVFEKGIVIGAAKGAKTQTAFQNITGDVTNHGNTSAESITGKVVNTGALILGEFEKFPDGTAAIVLPNGNKISAGDNGNLTITTPDGGSYGSSATGNTTAGGSLSLSGSNAGEWPVIVLPGTLTGGVADTTNGTGLITNGPGSFTVTGNTVGFASARMLTAAVATAGAKEILGDVDNSGLLVTGTITGNVTNTYTLIADTVTGDVTATGDATTTSISNLTGNLTAGLGTTTNLDVAAGNIANAGTLTGRGIITGNITNTGTADLAQIGTRDFSALHTPNTAGAHSVTNTGALTLGNADANIANTGTLYLKNNDSTWWGDVANNGRIDYVNAGRTLSVNTLGGTGVIRMDVDATNPANSDLLIIRTALTGKQTLDLTNVTPSTGAVTPDTTFSVVDVTGATIAPGASITGTVNIGLYTFAVNTTAANPDGTVHVAGSAPASQAAVNAAGAMSMGWFSQLDNLVKRMGELRLGDTASSGDAWIRGYGSETHANLGIAGISDFKEYQYGADIGADKMFALDETNRVALGVFTGYQGSTRRFHDGFGSSGNTDSVYAGVYGTWIHADGWYADGVIKGQYFDGDYKAAGDKGDFDNYGLGASIELGKQWSSENGWFVEPSVQFAYTHIFGDTYDTDAGIRVNGSDSDIYRFSGQVRFGKTIEFTDACGGNAGIGKLQPYAKLGVEEQISSGGAVRVSALGASERYEPSTDGTRMTYGAGMIWQLDDTQQIHVDYEGAFGDKYDRPWSVNAGYRVTF